MLRKAHQGFSAAWESYLALVDSAKVAEGGAEAHNSFREKANEQVNQTIDNPQSEAVRSGETSGGGSGSGQRGDGANQGGSRDAGMAGGVREAAPGRGGVQGQQGLTELFQSAFGGVSQYLPQTDTPLFQEWAQSAPLVYADQTLSYEGGPAVFEAFQGTTHNDITQITPPRRNAGSKEGALGAVRRIPVSPFANYFGPKLYLRLPISPTTARRVGMIGTRNCISKFAKDWQHPENADKRVSDGPYLNRL